MFRPQADDRKIHSKNEFELCYLRHRYIRMVDYNPSELDMNPYNSIITQQGRHTFYIYKNVFKMIGFEVEDVVNICRVHLVSFLGLFSLEKQEQKYQDFLLAHYRKYDKFANEIDISNKNKANFTKFLHQRMEELVRVCRQKIKNVKGLKIDEFQAFYGPVYPPEDTNLLLKDNEKYNFKKLDAGAFRTIKKKLKIRNNDKPFKFAGYWYIAVPLYIRDLNFSDFTSVGLDPYDNIHNKDPETLLFNRIEEEEFEDKVLDFKRKTDVEKINVVRQFLLKNDKNPKFSEEVVLAKRFIENLENHETPTRPKRI